jgi:hypothetical protein
MYDDKPRPKTPAKPFIPMSTSQEPRYTTHPNVVAGITILACFALFNVFFWVAIGIVNSINPPDAVVIGSGLNRIELAPSLADSLTGGRIILALIIDVIGTAVTWTLVRGFYEQG